MLFDNFPTFCFYLDVKCIDNYLELNKLIIREYNYILSFLDAHEIILKSKYKIIYCIDNNIMFLFLKKSQLYAKHYYGKYSINTFHLYSLK